MPDPVAQTPAAPTAPEEGGTAPLTPKESAGIEDAILGADNIVVAIHGIGDQYHNATLQTVVSAFGRFAGYPALTPLGRFHSVTSFRLKHPPPPPDLGGTAFVEVYWADIPRKVQKEGYVIEESKAWARTLVERIRARFDDGRKLVKAAGPKNEKLYLNLHSRDYFAAANAIEEMIETFRVLGNLLSIAEKAGLLRFDLDNLLTQYIGDVQIVADFDDYRRTILDKFGQVLDKIDSVNKKNEENKREKAPIYVIAHSEGTVVALMGLLEAMCSNHRKNRKGEDVVPLPEEHPPDWVEQLHGFMTFGSPIDKHLVLWPEMWESVSKPHADLAKLRPGSRIPWRNYYDYGDPVGFALDTARDWMKDPERRWDQVFEFDGEQHDYGFGRYLLPGAAHNDYWKDDEVFGHFIQTVMGFKAPKGAPSYEKRPGDKHLKRVACIVLPYVLVIGIVSAGVYLLYKGMLAYVTPNLEPTSQQLVRNVGGITALLVGMIALARIPRVTRAPRWFWSAVGIFAICAALYGWWVSGEVHNWLALRFFAPKEWANTHFFQWAGEGTRAALRRKHLDSGDVSAAFIILLATSISFFAAWGSRRRLHRWTKGWRAVLRPFFTGARPLIYPGAVWAFAIILNRLRYTWGPGGGVHGPLWPLLMASAAFLYLWWLATLLFDLVFVWHRYIRRSVAHNYLYALRLEGKNGTKKSVNNASPSAPSPAAAPTNT